MSNQAKLDVGFIIPMLRHKLYIILALLLVSTIIASVLGQQIADKGDLTEISGDKKVDEQNKSGKKIDSGYGNSLSAIIHCDAEFHINSLKNGLFFDRLISRKSPKIYLLYHCLKLNHSSLHLT